MRAPPAVLCSRAQNKGQELVKRTVSKATPRAGAITPRPLFVRRSASFLVPANFVELRYGEVRRISLPRRWVKKGPVGREDGISVPDRVMASIVHGRGPLVL